MPDPEMVSRAHRAAAKLEQAWERWRASHGLAAEPMRTRAVNVSGAGSCRAFALTFRPAALHAAAGP
jgi:hypothetical protein